MKSFFDSVHFQHFGPFFIIFMANYPFDFFMCTLLEGVEKVYVVYTHLNVGNYGFPLMD